ASPGFAVRRLVQFLAGLPLEFAFVPLVFAAYGLIKLRAASPFVFRFTLLLFAACVVYAVNYDIPDSEAYFLLAHIVLALWAAYGFRDLLEVAAGRRFRRRVWAAGGLAGMIAVPLLLNHAASDAR